MFLQAPGISEVAKIKQKPFSSNSANVLKALKWLLAEREPVGYFCCLAMAHGFLEESSRIITFPCICICFAFLFSLLLLSPSLPLCLDPCRESLEKVGG